MSVPDDLLRHVIGPAPYSSWWFWLAVVLSATLVSWYAGVLLLTSPGRTLRDVPLLGAARDRSLRHRSVRAVRTIGDRYRLGELEASQAGAAVSRELRRFLHRTTGARAEYMQMSEFADSEIALATGVLDQLVDVQFNAPSQVDVSRVINDAEELIQSWT